MVMVMVMMVAMAMVQQFVTVLEVMIQGRLIHETSGKRVYRCDQDLNDSHRECWMVIVWEGETTFYTFTRFNS
jgi:hypothetical protein